jgi:uncharacterized membrane protein YkgB
MASADGSSAARSGRWRSSAWSVIDRVDAKVVPLLRRVAVPLLRISLGIVFVWFGALKVLDVSPVSDLVASTVYWVDPGWFVPALGVFEMVVGLLLLLGRALRFTLFLFVAQMVGTFLTFAVLPDVTFRDGSPLLLTVEGEFVVKNLVLISAALVVGTTVRRRRRPVAHAAQVDSLESPEGARR